MPDTSSMATLVPRAVPDVRQKSASGAPAMCEDLNASDNGASHGDRPTLGAALRALRQARGISQEGWAARLGVGRRTVVRWEQGQTVPDAVMEEAIIAVCRERALFGLMTRGTRRGPTLTPELLRELMAEARVTRRGSELIAGSAHPTRGNLPAPLTSFIGREPELAEVIRLLDRTRLFTLTGAGGCGKTRLAIEVAARVRGRYRDGVWWVELAALPPARVEDHALDAPDHASVMGLVAGALGLREEPGRSLDEILVAYLRSRELLLILDNCEHQMAACARVVARLLDAAPGLRVLTTSRETLGLTGEVVRRVPSLTSPEPSAGIDPLSLAGYEAVRLFVERARAVRAGFAVTEANTAAVAHICSRLDGIPLAIELAAARLNVLSVEQIAGRLDDRFGLLTAGSRAARPRHQTLRALLDWSYELLSEPERRLFERLSVFAGGFTLEAVDAVGGDVRALDGLARLVDQSLVATEERHGELRYRLLETLRQYADLRLRERDPATDARARHRDYYLTWVEEGERALLGPEQAWWLERHADEHDNLRVALAWCLNEDGDSTIGLRFAAALWRYWELRGHFAEGRRWLEQALTRAGDAPPASRAKALNSAGVLARNQADYAAARRFHDESLALARAAGDMRCVATALSNLGLADVTRGDSETARIRFEEALAIRRQAADGWGIGNSLHNLGLVAHLQAERGHARRFYEESLLTKRATGDRQGIAMTLNNLAHLAEQEGDQARAHRLFDESIAIRRELGDERGVAFALHGLGQLAWREGDIAISRVLFTESLTIAGQLGNQKLVAECLEGMAAVLGIEGRPLLAARLLGAAEASREALKAPRPRSDDATYARYEAAISAGQDLAAVAAAREAGRALSPEQAMRMALADAGATSEANEPDR